MESGGALLYNILYRQPSGVKRPCFRRDPHGVSFCHLRGNRRVLRRPGYTVTKTPTIYTTSTKNCFPL